MLWGVVVPSVVSDVLGCVPELIERLIENAVIVLRNVEFDLDVPNKLHSSRAMPEVLRRMSTNGGASLAIGGVCEGFCRLPPTTEVVGSALGLCESDNTLHEPQFDRVPSFQSIVSNDFIPHLRVGLAGTRRFRTSLGGGLAATGETISETPIW
jgi:hypothetical protein